MSSADNEKVLNVENENVQVTYFRIKKKIVDTSNRLLHFIKNFRINIWE